MTRILFATDDPRALLSYFQEHGFDVSGAQTAAGALRFIDEHPPDIVILDVMLGGEPHGLVLCRALRARGFDRPILFLTDRASDEYKRLGFEAGADDYITLPVSRLVLKARVERLLKKVGTRRIHRLGGIEFDLDEAVIRWPGGQRRLSSRERDLVEYRLADRTRRPSLTPPTREERALLEWIEQLLAGKGES